MKLSNLMQDPHNKQESPISQSMAGSPKEEEDTMGAEAAMDPEQGEAPTAEEQQMYDQVVTAGLKILTEATDQILQMLQAGADNPPQALAETIWTIMSGIAEQAGGQIDEGILLVAGGEVLEQLADLANQAGVFPVDQNVLNQTTQIVLERFSAETGIDFTEEFGEDIQNMSADQLSQLASQFGGGQGGDQQPEEMQEGMV